MAANQLSQKDLHILEDQLTVESLLVKKFETAAQECTDSNLKDLCNKTAQEHKDHYNKLFGILNMN
ncbi:MAG: spore coat protein [Clostridiales bacterium]|nr:spore coat protein [Clostridiales bacterium]HBM81929.1 spore coat protein [Clostridiaceae bacterium]